jgi:hypothetical protein
VRATHSHERIQEVLLRAEARDPLAWLELAALLPIRQVGSAHDDIHPSRPAAADIEGSCLWLADRLGVRWGTLMLLHRIAKLSNGMITAAARAKLVASYALATRVEWLPPGSAVELLGVLGLVRVHIARKDPTFGRAPEEPAATTTDGPSSPEGALVCVLATSPPPPAGREERALVERYAVLSQPVPLARLPDADEVASLLEAEFPWLSELIERVRGDLLLAARLGSSHFRLPSLLIVGPSGVGKSRFARRLAETVGVPLGQVYAAGSSDNRALAGTGRGWSSATPCLPLTPILQHRIANPLILVDEVDKSGGSDRNGRLVETLLSMVDPTTARAWPDECLQVTADLLRVTWVLTANRGRPGAASSAHALPHRAGGAAATGRFRRDPEGRAAIAGC